MPDYDGPFTRRRLINELMDLQDLFDDNTVAQQMRGTLLEDTSEDSLPNNTDKDIFTVSGGRILVFAFWLEVTTAIQAQTTNVKLRWKPSGGSYGDLSAVVDCTGAALASCVCLASSTIGTAANLMVAHAHTGFSNGCQGLIFPAGTLGFHSATNSTGGFKGRLLWAPLDAAGTVALA